MADQQKIISYQELALFFLPLAIMPIIIGISHNAVNASLARLPYPEITIAVYAVAKGITNIIKSPVHMARQTVTALVNDQQSFRLVSTFLFGLGFFIFSLISILSYTNLGKLILSDLIGLKTAREISFAYQALRIMAFIPLVESFRNIFQGLTISLKKTKLITPGVTIRIICIAFILIWVTANPIISGIKAASLVWLLGITIESIFIFFALRHSYGNYKSVIADLSNNNYRISFIAILKFFIPIAIMAFLVPFVQPIVQAGIIRNSFSTVNLAAYGVSWTLVMIFVGSLDMLHQCTLVYSEDLNAFNWQIILKFSLIVGGLASLIFLIISLTPVGDFILIKLIAVNPQISILVKKIILAFVFFSIIRAFREIFWGIMMRRQQTAIIAVAKTVGLVFIVVSFIILTINTNLNAAIIAALAITIGETADAVTISWHIKQNKILKIIYAENKFNLERQGKDEAK